MQYLNNDFFEMPEYCHSVTDNFKVAVWCITYNHIRFIEKTIDSFLSQITSFPYKVVVFDDASTDGTSDILRRYMSMYPDIMRVYIAKYNTFQKPERSAVIKELTEMELNVKYIATCEGDDYWCNNNKLQSQYDFMEFHKDCGLMFHAAIWKNYKTNEEYEFHPFETSRFISPEELILKKNGNPSTASTFMRGQVYFYPDDFPICDVGDIKRQLYGILCGKVYYSDEVMCVYRFMHEGSWTSEVEPMFDKYIRHAVSMVVFFHNYNEYTDYKFIKPIRHVEIGYLYKLVEWNITYEDFCNAVLVYIEEQNDRTKFIAEEVLRVGNYIKNSDAKIDIIPNKNDAFDRVVIFGTGTYSEYCTRILRNSGLIIDGYIVSEKRKSNRRKINGLNVWTLDDYPYDVDTTLLVFGLNQRYEEDILQLVKEKGFINTFSPFWFACVD